MLVSYHLKKFWVIDLEQTGAKKGEVKSELLICIMIMEDFYFL